MKYEELEAGYKQWINFIQHNNDPIYYQNLLTFSPVIINDLDAYKQHFIAKQLRMSGPKLSTIKPVLEAYIAKA